MGFLTTHDLHHIINLLFMILCLVIICNTCAWYFTFFHTSLKMVTRHTIKVFLQVYTHHIHLVVSVLPYICEDAHEAHYQKISSSIQTYVQSHVFQTIFLNQKIDNTLNKLLITLNHLNTGWMRLERTYNDVAFFG